MAHSPSERIRVDLWLKHACVVKHRGEATEACRGGLVHVNEERVKPAHAVRIGDVIELSEPRYRKLVVLALPERQASKDEAGSFYRDETPPPPPRELELQIAVREKGAGRPTKRQRREMDRWNKS